MLDSNALQQLKGLKKQIRDSRDIRTGKYRPARNRFGFVTDADGNDVFLPPEEAQKLLPGDEVEIEVKELEDNRIQGKILKLVNSSFKKCHGVVVVKGKGFFVQIDDENHQWMFVPPKNRRGANHGDRVAASLLKHPYHNDSKAQVRIDEVIGNETLPGIETAYACARFGLFTEWPNDIKESTASLVEKAQAVASEREYCDLPFVTIDAASTRDLDDAIYAKSTDDGWSVVVAIADPAAVIEQHSALDKAAKKRGATVYFPHGPKPMLPEDLSSQALSLMPDTLRPALVVELQVSSEGVVSDVSFSLKAVKSVAKLTYFQVNDYISHGTIADELTDTIQHSIAAAKMATDVLRKKRDADALMNDSRQEYRLRLNDAGKVEDINEIERTPAHELVEETMLLCNIEVAKFLAANDAQGPYSAHVGVRPERVNEGRRLISEFIPDFGKNHPIETLQGFKDVKNACHKDEHKGLIRPLRRLLNRASIQNAPAEHFGLGVESYTTMTSPLRRYQDLLVHYQLYALIEGKEKVAMHNDQLETLSELLLNNRLAVRQSEADLLAQYAQKLSDKVFPAEVVQLNAKMITLRITTNGIQGVLKPAELGKKWKYDALRGKISNENRTVLLGDSFDIKIEHCDLGQRVINFTLAEKVEKAEKTEKAE